MGYASHLIVRFCSALVSELKKLFNVFLAEIMALLPKLLRHQPQIFQWMSGRGSCMISQMQPQPKASSQIGAQLTTCFVHGCMETSSGVETDLNNRTIGIR